MKSPCITQLTPAIMSASLLLCNDSELSNDDFNSVIMYCKGHPDDVTPKELDTQQRAIDDKVLCDLMCCCSKNPNTGLKAGTNQRQGCVSNTLQAVNEILDHKSRYKAEVSYNMDVNPPSPFMHRDASGQDTLQKSHHWQTRAKQDIPGYQGGQGDVRRPDVIIVKDPSKPPYQDNIDRVVEMKFIDDRWGEDQEESYVIIAGDEDKLILIEEGDNCTCADNDGEREPVPQPVTIPEEEPSVDWWAVSETVGMGALTVVGAVATIALVLVPFDGPAGEVAAGTATAAAAARTTAAFGSIFKAAPVPH